MVLESSEAATICKYTQLEVDKHAVKSEAPGIWAPKITTTLRSQAPNPQHVTKVQLFFLGPYYITCSDQVNQCKN